jgi:hypothetical protein
VLKGADATSGVPTSVAALADGVVKALLLPRPKVMAAGVLLLVSVLALGLGTFPRPGSAGPQSGETAAFTFGLPEDKEQAKKDPVQPADRKEPGVSGRVLDPEGKPVAKADVALLAWPKLPLRGSREFGPVKVVAQVKTDAKGRFQVRSPGLVRLGSVVAIASGHALGMERLDPDAEQAEVEIRLNREEAVRGRLVDLQGQPAAAVKVQVVSLRARLAPQNYQYASLPQPPKEPSAWPAPVTTDAKGRFVLHGLRPDWDITIAVRDERWARQDLEIKAQNKGKNEEVTLALAPARIVEGRVTYQDTGKPVANAPVMIVAGENRPGTVRGNSYWRTDAEGRFRAIPHPGNYLAVTAAPPAGEPYLLLTQGFQWPKGKAVKHEVDLKLPRGVVVRGAVTEAGSGKPVTGAHVQFTVFRANNPFYRANVLPNSGRWDRNLVSGSDGRFEVVIPPGPGALLVNGPTLDYLHDEILSTKLYGEAVRPERRHYADAIVSLSFKPEAPPQKVALKLRRGVTVSGRLLTPEGKPVARAQLLCQSYIPYGTHLNRVPVLPVGKGKFELPGYDVAHPLPVYFLDAENQLGAMVRFSAKEVDGKAVVKLQPCGSATARFVDAEGKPLANLVTHLDLALNDGISFFDSLESAT